MKPSPTSSQKKVAQEASGALANEQAEEKKQEAIADAMNRNRLAEIDKEREEAEREEREQQRAEEEKKWRDWTVDGKVVKAKFVSYVGGPIKNVVLELKDGEC